MNKKLILQNLQPGELWLKTKIYTKFIWLGIKT